VRELIVFSHRQGVDIRTQADRATTAAVLDDSDDSGFTQAPMHGIPQSVRVWR
jgi:hypothetical protein